MYIGGRPGKDHQASGQSHWQTSKHHMSIYHPDHVAHMNTSLGEATQYGTYIEEVQYGTYIEEVMR